MAIIGGDQGKAGESKGSGRKADDLRLSCLCLLLPETSIEMSKPPFSTLETDDDGCDDDGQKRSYKYVMDIV